MKKTYIFIIIPIIVLLSILECTKRPDVTKEEANFFAGAVLFKFYDSNYSDKFETIKRIKPVINSYGLQYNYDNRTAATDTPLIIIATAAYLFDGNDTDAIYNSTRNGTLAGIGSNPDYTFKEKDYYKYGDESKIYEIYNQKEPIGSYFILKKENAVYDYYLSGVYIDDPKIWESIIAGKVDKFLKYCKTRARNL